MKDKKGEATMTSLMNLGIGVAILAITLVVAFLVMAEAQDQIVDIQGVNESDSSDFTVAYNASMAMQDATNDVAPWVPIIIVTFIGAILIGMVTNYFVRRT